MMVERVQIRPRIRRKNERGYSTATTETLNHRSRLTNGKTFLPDVDGRSSWARRYRDILNAHIADLGGRAVLSEGQVALVRSIALMQVEAEFQAMKVAVRRDAGDGPGATRMENFRKQAESLRRLIESLQLNTGRKAKDVTPGTYEELRRHNTDMILDAIRQGDRYAA